MKKLTEIVRRAVILQCLTDRSAMEEKCINGIAYSEQRREEQRRAILIWMQEKGYFEFATEVEKTAFAEPVNGSSAGKIITMQFQYEALQPFLWAVNLMESLPRYDNYVVDDFHPILQISKNHSFDQLLLECKLRSKTEIAFQLEVSALWHWRMREYNNPNFCNKNIHETIREIFGEQYIVVLDYILENENPGLFEKGRLCNELTDETAIVRLEYARWRHQAFEWMIGDDSWDKVELNT